MKPLNHVDNLSPSIGMGAQPAQAGAVPAQETQSQSDPEVIQLITEIISNAMAQVGEVLGGRPMTPEEQQAVMSALEQPQQVKLSNNSY